MDKQKRASKTLKNMRFIGVSKKELRKINSISIRDSIKKEKERLERKFGVDSDPTSRNVSPTLNSKTQKPKPLKLDLSPYFEDKLIGINEPFFNIMKQ